MEQPAKTQDPGSDGANDDVKHEGGEEEEEDTKEPVDDDDADEANEEEDEDEEEEDEEEEQAVVRNFQECLVFTGTTLTHDFFLGTSPQAQTGRCRNVLRRRGWCRRGRR